MRDFKQERYDRWLDRREALELDGAEQYAGKRKWTRRRFPAIRRIVDKLLRSMPEAVAMIQRGIRRSESESDTAWMNRMIVLEREYMAQLTAMEQEATAALADCANGMRALLIERGNDEHETVDRTPKEDRRRPQDPA